MGPSLEAFSFSEKKAVFNFQILDMIHFRGSKFPPPFWALNSGPVASKSSQVLAPHNHRTKPAQAKYIIGI
jgi:hypothetical protein